MTLVAIDRLLGRPKTATPVRQIQLDWHVEVAIFGVLMLIGTMLRFATIGMDSLWIDEGHTMAVADLSYIHLWTVPFDTHPPLHVTFVKMLMGVTSTDLALRLPSAIFSTATLVVIYALARRLTGPVGALVALAIVALSYTFLVYANNGRNYAQLVFFLSLACLAFQMMVDRLDARKTWRDRGLLTWSGVYAVSALAALYTHNSAVLYLFALNGMGCILIAARDRLDATPAILHLAVTNVLALALWLPWLSVMLGGAGAFNWLEQKSMREAAFVLAATIGPNQTGLLGPALFFLAMLGGVWQVSRQPNWLTAMVWFHLAIVPGFIWIMGWIIQPVYMERTILPAVFGAALAIAALAAKTRPQGPALAATALVLLVSTVSALSYVKRSGEETALGAQLVQDWRGAIDSANVQDADFVICDTFSFPVVAHYAEDRRVAVNSQDELWEFDLDDWRAIYGNAIAERLRQQTDGTLGDDIGIRWAWPAFADGSGTIAFLKPDLYCNDGEDEIIRGRLIEAGYMPYSVRRHVGLRVETFKPVGN